MSQFLCIKLRLCPAYCWVLKGLLSNLYSSYIGVLVGVSVVVGNCIVDASILFLCLFVGSQGRSVDALALRADEGRCSLR